MTKYRPWGVHSLRDMIGSGNEQTQDDLGVWVRAVPMPYTANRLVAVWWVLTGRAQAVIWPKAGDFERVTGSYMADTECPPNDPR